jgi:hypothetical protein
MLSGMLEIAILALFRRFLEWFVPDVMFRRWPR